ncbi:MAG: hypothetical protein DCC65_06750 [Planctomycetota bacterium]|nr:MAG: hypothetical protein DCC65_06750 [Planctomycetota bacterium]
MGGVDFRLGSVRVAVCGSSRLGTGCGSGLGGLGPGGGGDMSLTPVGGLGIFPFAGVEVRAGATCGTSAAAR